MSSAVAPAPLIVHVLDRLSVGGMENGLVNIINHGPVDEFRHAIVCLTAADDFRHRLASDDVAVIELHKRPGKDLGVYARLFTTLRELKPALVHSRNLSAVDTAIVAFAAGVRARVHSEHGRDTFDLHGTNRKYNLLRRLVSLFVDHYICVSEDLARWLRDTIGVTPHRITQIYNGVDQSRFHPGSAPTLPGFDDPNDAPRFVIGHVGRVEKVKDQATLVRAFVALTKLDEARSAELRLVLIGDGSGLDSVRAIIADAGLDDQVWFAGSRNDVAELLRAFDVFVLPSMSEGISNTIIEAMATGLPVVATRVGGNPELVVDGVTGFLVPAGDPQALAGALHRYLESDDLARRQGAAALEHADANYAMPRMIDQYYAVYRSLTGTRRPHTG